MGILNNLLGKASAEPIHAIGNIIDSVWTTEEEKLDRKALMLRIAQQPQLLQSEINKVEAAHRSVFVAGWRPCIGWVCAVGLAYTFLINPTLQWMTGQSGPDLPTESMMTLVLSLLGVGAMRTVEKMGGKAK